MTFRGAVLLAAMLPHVALAGVTASSEGTNSAGERQRASHLVDGLLSTAWAEGDEGHGEGSWVELSLDRTTDVKSVSIWPGKIDQGSRGLREYGRPHTLTVTLKGGGEEVSKEVRVLDIAETGPVRLDIPIEGKARKIRVTLDKVYGGGIRSDTYLTEVAVNFGQSDHPSLAKFQEWRGSDAGVKARDAFEEDLAEAKETISESDFGDRDLFRQIMAAASDGPAFETARASRSVTDGYRIAAVPPSRFAMNALLELDDPNAIAALELAATRSTGDLQAKIEDRVSRYRAAAELKGGERRNVKPYGESGWCKGCLRGFGEPLDVAADAFGALWIADTGNHRVQRFGFDGIAQGNLGMGESQITNIWLGGRPRPWYGSARKPTSEPGGYGLPVGLAVVPAKAGDTLLVLNGSKVVNHVDADGKVIKSWTVGAELPLGARVGGEGYIALVKGQVVVAWSDEVFVYSLDGEEQQRFTLEDGVAGGLVGFKNGRIGVWSGDDLIAYSLDGFRFGGTLGETVPRGYEYVALATDERSKLWVVTDTGYAIKYKKPGKVDYQVRLVDRSFAIPRLAVYQDLLFVTDEDRIRRFDALQMHQDAEAAEE